MDQYIGNPSKAVLYCELTLLGNDRYYGILINVFHCLHATLIDRCHDVDTADPTLAISRSIEQRCLEVRIELGIELSVVAKDNSDGLVRIDASDLEVCTQSMLHEVAMVRRHLEAI